MSTSSPTELSFTRDEEATLKSALAFVVLRNNYKKRKLSPFPSRIMAENEDKNTRNSNVLTNHDIPFCRDILFPSTKFPNVSIPYNIHHMEQMIRVALSAIPPTILHGQKSTVFLISTIQTSMDDRVESIASHIVHHILGCSGNEEEELTSWFEKWTMSNEITSICTFWLCMAQSNKDFCLRMINIICGLIKKIYFDEIAIDDIKDTNDRSADVITVNLLCLIEALIAFRCSGEGSDCSSEKVLQEFLTSIQDQQLTLPIPVHQMPSFLHQQQAVPKTNLSPPSKILLRLALYDLTLKLTKQTTKVKTKTKKQQRIVTSR